jgi:hypothetical protein
MKFVLGSWLGISVRNIKLRLSKRIKDAESLQAIWLSWLMMRFYTL